MDARELVSLTNSIVQSYYRNDIEPFLGHVDEHVLWYGPAKGQFLSGRQALLDAWAGESHSLTFTLGNVQLDHSTTHPSYCEVMMSFPVTTHYPEGESVTFDQIIHITWCERKIGGEKAPRMLVVHISDLYQKHEDDNIYPVHFIESFKSDAPALKADKRVFFRSTDASDHYVLPDTVIWAESVDNGRHCILHTSNGPIKVSSSIASLEKEHPDFLLRCHRCHLVNPRHVTCVSRFKATLSDGTELPVPEKKYTAFKKAVEDQHKS